MIYHMSIFVGPNKAGLGRSNYRSNYMLLDVHVFCALTLFQAFQCLKYLCLKSQIF